METGGKTQKGEIVPLVNSKGKDENINNEDIWRLEMECKFVFPTWEMYIICLLFNWMNF